MQRLFPLWRASAAVRADETRLLVALPVLEFTKDNVDDFGF